MVFTFFRKCFDKFFRVFLLCWLFQHDCLRNNLLRFNHNWFRSFVRIILIIKIIVRPFLHFRLDLLLYNLILTEFCKHLSRSSFSNEVFVHSYFWVCLFVCHIFPVFSDYFRLNYSVLFFFQFYLRLLLRITLAKRRVYYCQQQI